MLFTKDVKTITEKGDDKKYTAYVFDKPNFAHLPDSKVVEHTTTTNKKPTIMPDGTEFKGTKPAVKVLQGLTTEQIDGMYDEMFAYVVPRMLQDVKSKKGLPKPSPYKAYANERDAARLYCLVKVTEAISNMERMSLDGENRETSIDLAAARAIEAKQHMRKAKDKGKPITELEAYHKVARSEALDLCEESDVDLELEDALLMIEWYQDMLKKQPTVVTAP